MGAFRSPFPSWAAALHNPAMFPQKIKLRATIFVGVLLITTGLAALLLLLNWLSSARAVRTFTRDLLDPIAHQVTEQTRDMLDSAASAAEVAAAVIGDVPAELRSNALDVVGSALLSSERALAYVQLGLPDGGWVRISRRGEGSLESQARLVSGPEAIAPRTIISRRAPGAPRAEILERTDVDASYDPRTRPWYTGAQGAKGVFLTDAYAHFPDDTIVVTAAISIRAEGGADAGVVSVAITLTEVADMLARLRVAGRLIRGFVLDPAQGTLAAAGAGRADGHGAGPPRAAARACVVAGTGRRASGRSVGGGGRGWSVDDPLRGGAAGGAPCRPAAVGRTVDSDQRLVPRVVAPGSGHRARRGIAQRRRSASATIRRAGPRRAGGHAGVDIP